MTGYHAAARALAHVLRWLPRRWRWPALLLASAAAAPAIRRSAAEPGVGIDGFREMALWRLMVAAGKARLAFDPVVEHHGLAGLETLLTGDRGVLVVGPHALLCYLTVRHMHDLGCDPVLVSADTTIPIFGTGQVPRGIPASPTLLADAVRHLRAGDLVCAMIDRLGPEKGTFEVETRLGPIHVADPLLMVASRIDAEILFCTVRIAGGRVQASWAAASRPRSAASLRREFGAFLQARIEEGHGRGGPRDLAARAGRLRSGPAGAIG